MVKPARLKNSLKILVVILLVFSTRHVQSQTISAADKKQLRLKEDSLKKLAANIILDSLSAGRMRSDSQFIRTFVRALQIRNSFYYPFDSVRGVSKLYAPDTSFRIYTWNISFDEYYSRQRGAVQMRTADGSLKLFPLRDYSEFTESAIDSVRTKDNWIGAVYYDIVKTTHRGKNYYTLIGYDDNNAMSNKKWIEVLSFNERNEPVFGGPFFSFEKDSVKRATQSRFILEYKKEARTILQYDDENKLIIVDHLISETDEPENKWTLVPDGDYEGFKWENGKWTHIDKVYDFKIDMKGSDFLLGKPPVGDPLFDQKGGKDEKKLQEKTDKNKPKKKDGKSGDEENLK
jgi:hypothetical protein